MNTPTTTQHKEDQNMEHNSASPAEAEAPVAAQEAQESATSTPETPVQDHAASAAQAALPSAPEAESNPLLKSLPLLLSLAALLLASYAFFIAQQSGGDQQAQIQSLAMRMGGLENQTDTLQSQMDKMGAVAENQREVMIHNELSTIASSLQKIAPLAQGEQQALIQQMQQLLDGKSNSSESTDQQ